MNKNQGSQIKKVARQWRFLGVKQHIEILEQKKNTIGTPL